MVSFMFWNVGRLPRRKQIARLAESNDVDVVLLAEVPEEPADLLVELNRSETRYLISPGIANTKILAFTRFPHEFFRPCCETDRLTIRRLRLPGMEEILLAAVHFPSKLHWSDESQALECTQLALDLHRQETEVGHERTILVGDLNMNPFESGMVSAAGLHAVMDRRVAREASRVVQGRSYPFFYNPMWSLLGDESRGRPGTYFHRHAEHECYFWNMFDQVLVRPALLDRFKFAELAVLEHTGAEPLVKGSGVPDRENGSDHLPILFRLNLQVKA
jgi:endonuclease/exonuclease/phosphatase family metal-dependent hydrolase